MLPGQWENLTHRRSSVGDLSMRTGKNAFELRRWMHLSACLEKIPSRSVCSECGGVLSCMKLSPLHGFQINVAAEEGGDGGNRRTDVADVDEVTALRREPAEVGAAADADVEDAGVDRRRDG